MFVSASNEKNGYSIEIRLKKEVLLDRGMRGPCEVASPNPSETRHPLIKNDGTTVRLDQYPCFVCA